MQRRDLLRVLGGSLIPALAGLGPNRLFALGADLHGRSGSGVWRTLSAGQAELVAAVADLIIPRTDSPGATDAGVPAFVDLLLAEWYRPDERDDLLGGMAAIDLRAREEGGSVFAHLPDERKAALATSLDNATARPAGSAEAAFRQLKGLTVYGYFTSETVVTTVLKTPVVPGRFGACEHV